MIAWVFLFVSSGRLGESHFDYSEESFLPYSHESLFSGFPDINNFLLSDIDDHVQAFHLPSHDFGDPQGSVHQLFGCLDGDELLALSEEESEGTTNVLA